MHILHVVGTRPNFIKAAPVLAALALHKCVRQTLVHTGQHYDANMSEVFFEQLGLPRPDVNLQVGSGSHAVQTAQVMMRFEKVVLAQRPDLVLVYGDVNSTVAAALVCAKLHIPVGHVEAGLRSFDRRMPEEINRLITDQIADLLFTPSTDSDENLQREGIPALKIHQVGNVMIDTLVRLLPQTEMRPILAELGLQTDTCNCPTCTQPYGLVTLHRPSNVDHSMMLADILAALHEIAVRLPLVFPVHPRTRERILADGLERPSSNVRLLDPLGYLDFLSLLRHASLVITDSGGIQEETTYLEVPCLTLRENTERPVTVTLGTNTLVGHDVARLKREADRILNGQTKAGQVPPLWDGHTAWRIADVIQVWFRSRGD